MEAQVDCPFSRFSSCVIQAADSVDAQSSSSETDEDDSEEEVELFSDDDVPASKIRELVSKECQQDGEHRAKRPRKQ